MNRNYLIAALLLLSFSGCLRLDSNLFNNGSDITEYRFDDYDGRYIAPVGPEYDVADSMTMVFTLESQGPEDESPVEIYAIYVGDTARIATDTVILYLHGNADNMDTYWQRIKLLAHAGGEHRFGILEIDYRGYGLSGGMPTEAGLYADTEAALNWLQEKGLTSNRLVMYGFSMGSAPATELTANPAALSPAWLMLEAPFASAEMMGQDASGLAMPGSFFTNLEINNADEIRKVNQPFFLIHGINDNFLNIRSHGDVVWQNYPGDEGTFLRIPGADHSDIPYVQGQAEYVQAVEDFILRP